MAVTGGIKFFDLNLADSKTGTSATASTGSPSANFILDRNQYTVWRSVGSNDSITESVQITFLPGITFNRLFLLRHNFKEYKLRYWTGISFTDFPAVTGINGITAPSLKELDYSLNSSYYEFSPIFTTRIEITSVKTQIPNQEKFLNSLVVSNELGTLDGYPVVRDATKDRKIRKSILLNGRSSIVKSLEVFRCFIDFKNYPPTLSVDLDLLFTLFDRDNSFFVWLCGGRSGEPYFKYQLRGFGIDDLILVQVVNIFKDKYRKNTYSSMVDMKFKLEEAG